MSFLKAFFSRTYSPTARQTVYTILQRIQIHSEQALPDNYYELLFTSTTQHYTKQEILTQILICLSNAKNESTIIKLYTIVMCAIRLSNYDELLCQVLQQLQSSSFSQTKEEKGQRLLQLQKSCKSYLIKLSSISQLYRNSLSKNTVQTQEEHVNLFRMMNQLNLLFPSFNLNINSVGRYYKQTWIYYKQFYRVWQSQIVLGYLTIKKSVDSLLKHYQKIDQIILQCFLSTIPSVQLLCDQMQNFMTNKYYRGKGPNKKIYFKEQQIKQIEYYLLKSTQSKKDEEFIKTAQDDFFTHPIQNK